LDHCPTCRRGFTVPGHEALNSLTAAEDAAQVDAANVRAERLQAKQLRERERVAALAQAMRAADDKRKQRERLAEEARQAKSLADASALPNSNPERAAKPRRTWWAIGGAAATFILLFVAYGVMRGADLRSKLDRCESKGAVTVSVSYSGLVGSDSVVFDLRDGASSGARRIDPVHLLMQFADKLDLSTVVRVVLARDGQPRFYIMGSDLRRLADSYAGGGRIWAFDNLPASVRRVDGTRAFEEWSGGWLGVLERQTKDLGDFITQWEGDE